MTVRCLIVEDQAPARRVLESYLARLPDFEVVGSSAAPSTAAAIMASERVDLLLLDLGLPQQDGFDFLFTLETPPVVIVTTAYAARAVEGFTHGVADYLVKPFAFERFKLATDRAVSALRTRGDNAVIAIPVERGHQDLIECRNIRYLCADGDYVEIHTTERRLLTLGPLSRWIEELPSPPLVRIHRSHAVNINHITSIGPRHVDIAGRNLPVSSTYVEPLKAAMAARADSQQQKT